MYAAVKALARPDKHVGGSPCLPEDLVRQLAPPPVRGRGVGDYYHQVVVAVGGSLPAGHRTEEIDPLGLVRMHQALDDLGEPRLHVPHAADRRSRLLGHPRSPSGKPARSQAYRPEVRRSQWRAKARA